MRSIVNKLARDRHVMFAFRLVVSDEKHCRALTNSENQAPSVMSLARQCCICAFLIDRRQKTECPDALFRCDIAIAVIITPLLRSGS
jgi:hypothetical protein